MWQRSSRRFSPEFGKRVLSIVGLFLLLLAGGTVYKSIDALSPELSAQKDFLQDYLISLAARQGVNPYQPVSVLENQLLGSSQKQLFWHPSPHPPPVALLTFAFSFLPYPAAAAAWLVFEIVLLMLLCLLMLKLLPASVRPQMLFAGLLVVMLSSRPVEVALILGQLSLLVAVLVVSAYYFLIRQRNMLSGVLLGCCLSIKFFAWPIVLYFLLKGRVRIVAACIATFCAINICALAVIGVEGYYTYFSSVIPAVGKLYLPEWGNFSILTIGQRLFVGLHQSVLISPTVPPLIDAPWLAGPASVVCAAALLCGGLAAASKASSTGSSFAMLLCVSVIIAPICWVHGLVVLSFCIIPVAEYWSRPEARRWWLDCVCVACCVLLHSGDRFGILLFDEKSAGEAAFIVSLISWIPMLTVIAVIWMLHVMAGVHGSQNAREGEHR